MEALFFNNKCLNIRAFHFLHKYLNIIKK